MREVVEDISLGMNTTIACRMSGMEAKDAMLAARFELAELENKLSRYLPSSEVSEINRLAGCGKLKISSETFSILTFARQISELSQGLFDVTAGPLIDLWDYKRSTRVPGKDQIYKALSLVDYRKMVLQLKDKTVSLVEAGQKIDLGGIAKGYASNHFIEICKQSGINSAYINIGGNVSTRGDREEGVPWIVGIRHPRRRGCLLGTVRVTGKSVVTSGDYERFFMDQKGRRWHHILDPTTGYPAQSGLISVTVVTEDAMVADALSTALFLAGMEKGVEYLKNLDGVEAIFVDKQQRIFITQGIKECFQNARKKAILVGEEN